MIIPPFASRPLLFVLTHQVLLIHTKNMINSSDDKIEFAKSLVDDIFITINKKVKEDPSYEFEDLNFHFLSTYLGVLVFHTLTKRSRSKKSKNQVFDETAKGYARVKTDVQNAVSAAFQGAMSTFTNRDVEYYCQIHLVPEPINERPC